MVVASKREPSNRSFSFKYAWVSKFRLIPCCLIDEQQVADAHEKLITAGSFRTLGHPEKGRAVLLSRYSPLNWILLNVLVTSRSSPFGLPPIWKLKAEKFSFKNNYFLGFVNCGWGKSLKQGKKHEGVALGALDLEITRLRSSVQLEATESALATFLLYQNRLLKFTSSSFRRIPPPSLFCLCFFKLFLGIPVKSLSIFLSRPLVWDTGLEKVDDIVTKGHYRWRAAIKMGVSG